MKPAALTALLAVAVLPSTVLVCEGGKQEQKLSVLGSGQGLAEVIVLVRDLEMASDVYRNILGFRLPPQGSVYTLPSGLKLIGAKFETGTYLELRSIDDREKAMRQRPEQVDFLEKHEGALVIVLDVSSAKSTAAFLRSRGFKVDEERFPQFSVVSFEDFYNSPGPEASNASPARAVVFSEYTEPPQEKRSDSKLEEEWQHPNSAKGIQVVWIAVRDLKTAIKAYESVGLPAGEKRSLPELGATGREVKAGQGVILLLSPRGENSKIASFLADRGEGIMGIGIEVRDLKAARELLEKNTERKFVPFAGPYGKSILIPAELTHGIWIEMFQMSERNNAN